MSAEQPPPNSGEPPATPAPAARPAGKQRYDRQAIAELLRAAFDAVEFENFCQDHFPDVARDFTVGQANSDRVRALLRRASGGGWLDRLVRRVRDERAPVYEEFRPRLWLAPGAPDPGHEFDDPDGPEGGVDAPRVEIEHLPETRAEFYGRGDTIGVLDEAWARSAPNVIVLHAWGGVGKTALLNEWLRRLEADHYRGARRVYAWSFYRQGVTVQRQGVTIEQGDVSADAFLQQALEWFGDPDPTQGSSASKGRRLADFVRAQRTLLILDGLEPLQVGIGARGQPARADAGSLLDEGIRALLKRLAAQNPGLCVVTTRVPVKDLTGLEGGPVRQVPLSHLEPAEGADVLRSFGLDAPEEQLREISVHFGGHPLALTLLGSYLRQHGDDVGRWRDVPPLGDDDAQLGGHARRVMASYAASLNPTQRAALALLGLFDRQAEPGAVDAVRRRPPVPGLNDQLCGLSDSDWRALVKDLADANLLTAVRNAPPGTLDAHPLVREYFGRPLRDAPDAAGRAAWAAGNDRLYDYFRSVVPPRPPGTIKGMESLFRAVAHGCRAGRPKDAFDRVYVPLVMDGRRFHAAYRLGAITAVVSVLAEFFEPGEPRWAQPFVAAAPGHAPLAPADELRILIHAGILLQHARGYSSPDARACCDRAERLATDLRDSASLCTIMLMRWRRQVSFGSQWDGLRVAEQALALAQQVGSVDLALAAYAPIACTLNYMGEYEAALDVARRGLAARAARPIRPDDVFHLSEPAASCMSQSALALWHLGFPERALALNGQAVADGRRLRHAHTVALAVHFEAYLRHFSRRVDEARAKANDLIELARAHGFPAWEASGQCVLGWALASAGDVQAGVEQIRRGIANWERADIFTCTPYYRAMLAEALLLDPGRTDEAGAVVEDALARADQCDDRFWELDLYRLRAEVCFRRGDADGAEYTLRDGIELADRRADRMLGLRLKTRLAELLAARGQGGADDARAALASAYLTFTEGFGFPDLVRAREVLERLGESLPPLPPAPAPPAPVAPAPGRPAARVGLVLGAEFDGFGRARRTEFALAVEALVGLPPGTVEIVSVEPGSVRIVIELPPEAAATLLGLLVDQAPRAAAFVRAFQVRPAEAAPAAPPAPAPDPAPVGGGGAVNLVALRDAIDRLFDREELDVLCDDVSQRLRTDGRTDALPFSADDVGGDRKTAIVRRLINHLDRRRCLAYLVDEVRRARPGVDI